MSLLSIVGVGIISFWPIVRLLFIKLLASFISCTDMLYSLAIEYNVSPDFTVYLFSSTSSLSPGIFNTWPIDNKLDVRLLILFNSSTGILYHN